MSRPRVADDFAAIRARMEQLQREHAQILASGQDDREKLRSTLARREEGLHKPGIIPVLERRPKV